jgi:hypothetical protein
MKTNEQLAAIAIKTALLVALIGTGTAIVRNCTDVLQEIMHHTHSTARPSSATR